MLVVEGHHSVLVEHVRLARLPVGLELTQGTHSRPVRQFVRHLVRHRVQRVAALVEISWRTIGAHVGNVVERSLIEAHVSIVGPVGRAAQGRTALVVGGPHVVELVTANPQGRFDMRILIAVASRHGSTADIARRLAERLTEAGHEPDVLDLVHDRHRGDRIDDLTRFGAFVVGSAIYEGHWLRQARTFVLENAVRLQDSPVFLFSSGPLGDGERTSIYAGRIDELVHAVDAVEHRVFSGRLDRGELGRIERWIVDVVRAHEGDFREWAVIDAWAAVIDARLAAHTNSAAT